MHLQYKFYNFIFYFVPPTDPRYTVSESGSLLISSVARNDKGLYTCIVRNPAGRVEKHVRVRVTNPITGTSEPTTTELYKILPPPRNLSHCVEYNDIRFGGDIPFVNLTSSVSGGSSGPRLTAVPHACVQTRLAYRIVLSCVGTGSPIPSLSWTKDGQLIPEVSHTWLNAHNSYYAYDKIMGGWFFRLFVFFLTSFEWP